MPVPRLLGARLWSSVPWLDDPMYEERYRAALIGQTPTSFEVVPRVYEQPLSEQNAHWLLTEVLCYLTHLQALGEAERIPGEPERWTA